MALVNCPECGREISDQAVSCPGCGRQNEKAKKARYQLNVPQEEYRSDSGTYLRFCGYFVWIMGVIAAIICGIAAESFWIFLVMAAVSLIAGLVPICFAQFFDDVHTIRGMLQGMALSQAEQEGKTAVTAGDKYVCTNCGKEYAKFYDACPFCGQKN